MFNSDYYIFYNFIILFRCKLLLINNLLVPVIIAMDSLLPALAALEARATFFSLAVRTCSGVHLLGTASASRTGTQKPFQPDLTTF